MYRDTVQILTEDQDADNFWSSEGSIRHGDIDIPLCQVIGPNASPPPNVPNQPKFHPKNSVYTLDTNRFKGIDSKKDVENTIRAAACSGCKMYLKVNGQKRANSLIFQLRCSRYKVHEEKSDLDDTKSDITFTKDGVRSESTKYKRSNEKQTAWSRMKNHKMKSKPRVKQTIDRRSKGNSTTQIHSKRRTSGNQSEDTTHRCFANVEWFMDIKYETWHLSTNSNLEHRYHPRMADNASLFAKEDLTDENIAS